MTVQQKSFQYRIYPTKEQKQFLAKQFGSVRFVYNFFLNNRKSEYLNNKKSLNYYDDAKTLTTLKNTDGYEWLYEINSQTLQASLRNLEVSYQNFFKKRTKFPRFHKKSNDQCIKIPQGFDIREGKLHIPKLKSGIKIKLHRELPSKQTCLFIRQKPSGKYYASFLCEVDIEALPKIDKAIGIDLGIKSFLVSSEGKDIKSPNFYRKQEKKLAYENRQLHKKKLGSNNRNKQRKEIAKRHEYIANQRKDFLHKISRALIDENQIIIAESLSVKNMMQNRHLSKSIGDAGWGELLQQLEYKALWYGRTFYRVGHFFPSSKTCSSCQFVLDSLPLSVREWDCPNCKMHHDRDINAAINIRDKGLLDLKSLSGSGMESDIKQKLGEAFSAAHSFGKKYEKSMSQDAALVR